MVEEHLEAAEEVVSVVVVAAAALAVEEVSHHFEAVYAVSRKCQRKYTNISSHGRRTKRRW